MHEETDRDICSEAGCDQTFDDWCESCGARLCKKHLAEHAEIMEMSLPVPPAMQAEVRKMIERERSDNNG